MGTLRAQAEGYGLEQVVNRRSEWGARLALVAATAFCAVGLQAWGQSDAAARRDLEISVWGGAAGVWTGLANGHNGSISAGVDVGFRPFFGLLPAAEVRGLYPVKSGTVDDQKNVLAGLRLEKRRGRLRVWGDILYGRGEITYQNGGFLNPAGDFRYLTSTSNVFSPGAGLSVDLNRQLSVFGDAQFQHYDTPATVSGTLWSKPVTVGVTYRLPFLKHGRPY